MGTSLTGLTPATTYDALIKVGDNGPLSATAKVLSDGLGNDSPLSMSTTLVGIGTASPTNRLTISSTAAYGLQVFRSDAADSRINITNSTTTSGTDKGLMLGMLGVDAYIDNYESGAVIMLTDDTERMRITADGYVRLSSNSGGIQFNGDTAAANALDDYEEGTWTPVFSGATTAGNYTYSGGGSYTKIGNQVTAWCTMIDLTQVSAGTGDWKISGLPFTISNNNSLQRLSSSIWVRQALNTRNNLLAIASAGTTSVFPLYDNQASGGGNAFTIAGDFQNNMDIGFTVTYFV